MTMPAVKAALHRLGVSSPTCCSAQQTSAGPAPALGGASPTFQVNRAKRYADLQKRTSLTSETALGGRCSIHASRTQYTRPPGWAVARTWEHLRRRWRDQARAGCGFSRSLSSKLPFVG